jgi:molybdate transport system substrate-binding protein
MRLHVLSGGAAQGLVTALSGEVRAATGYEIDGTFGAVGAMKEKLLAGAPTDVLILTRALIDELAASGHVVPETRADLGKVRTGVAVRAGDAPPDVSSSDGLRAALLAASAIFFPDPQRATAGVHFTQVLERLGISYEVAGRLSTHPNGATAMRALANATGARPIGVTQITEILNTPGVALVGPLPREFELATTYTAAVCTRAAAPHAARRFVALVSGEGVRAVRTRAGFERQDDRAAGS